MTTIEIYYRKFEHLPQKHQLSTIFNSTIEEVFETLETADIDMSTDHSMIEPTVNRYFVNTLHHQNGPNQCQHIHRTLVNIIDGNYRVFTQFSMC